MEKSFDPKQIESKWYARWEQLGCFEPSGRGDPYCILLPPPNVTGTLHMGHAFQQTIMDALIRYHRMRGDNTLWQVGTDHAGIATQKIVENQLAAEGKSRNDLGRDQFVERVWKWKEESGSTITRQMRRFGGLVARTLHDGRRPERSGAQGIRRVVSRRPDLSRQPAGELGSGADDRGVGPRGQQRRARRFSVVDPLSHSGGRREHRHRHDAPRNDVGRRGSCRASRG